MNNMTSLYRFAGRVSVCLALSSLSTVSRAEPDPIDAKALTIASNINMVSHYRFRGIDQTWGHPALQGGVDANWSNGWYAGLWASNVSGNSYPGGSLELDYYGGFNGRFREDWSFSVGGYGYAYPGANLAQSACPSAAMAAPCSQVSQRFDTFEVNAGVSWKWVSYKLSISATDYFGANVRTGYSAGSRGTRYHDLSVNLPLSDRVSLVGHWGRTELRARYGGVSPSYNDMKLGVNATWGDGWNGGLAWVRAGNDRFYRPPTGGLSYASQDTKNLNRSGLVLQFGRTF